MRFFFSVVALSAVIFCGCVKEVKDLKDYKGPEESSALETAPYLHKGDVAFDTRVAVREAQNMSEEEGGRAIKKRIENMPLAPKIFDPWVPPAVILNEKLPKALQYFPKDKYGYPSWTAAVQRGILNPRESLDATAKGGTYLFPEGSKEAREAAEKYIKEQGEFDRDILFEINDRLMNNVLFPHKTHNYWLSCKVCHPGIFKAEKGANIFTMYDIWAGNYCGRCHGKVSYQPKGYNNCQRCHSVRKKTMGIR